MIRLEICHVSSFVDLRVHSPSFMFLDETVLELHQNTEIYNIYIAKEIEVKDIYYLS